MGRIKMMRMGNGVIMPLGTHVRERWMDEFEILLIDGWMGEQGKKKPWDNFCRLFSGGNNTVE